MVEPSNKTTMQECQHTSYSPVVDGVNGLHMNTFDLVEGRSIDRDRAVDSFT